MPMVPPTSVSTNGLQQELQSHIRAARADGFAHAISWVRSVTEMTMHVHSRRCRPTSRPID